ncbi:MAG: SIS domain-containing protein [Rhodocyclaceae bacterium]|nr:SIS domain-containing protein [Rhodocyclaceae bacterium]MCA3083609.1 SIS domain-containing protein [Rhodocyclaceae bacterium]
MPLKAPVASTTLLDRIEALIDTLRPSEKLVGRFVLRHPNLVISLSFPDIAAKCGVSQPTVARFCVAVGFNGYRDFKLRLAQSLALGVPFVHHDVGMQDSMAEVGAKVFDRGIAALVSVRNHLDPHALTQATKLLAEASRIEFYGLGNSGIVALDAQHKFFRLGVPAVAYSDPHIHAMAASLLGKQDVVVAISGTGRTRELIRSAEIARDAGASVIAITASGSPLARLATVVLFADVREDLDVYAPMTSRMVHLVLLDVLSVGVAVARGPALAKRLKRAKEVIADRRTEDA